MSRPVRRNIRLYYTYGFLMQFGLWSGIWIKYLLDDRGLELKWILAMDLPFWLLVAALQAPTGALADRVGRKPVMALGSVLFALTILGFGFTTNYWMLFFDYVLWAIAMSLYMGADSALVYDSLRENGQESQFAKIAGRGFGAQLLAGMLGVALGGFFATWTSLALTVQVSAITPLLAMGVALAMHEAPLERKQQHYWQGLKGAMSFAWKNPPVRYTLLIGSVMLTGVFGPVVLVQPFLLEHDVSTSLFGVWQAPLRLTSVAAAFLAFQVGRRTGIWTVLVVASVGVIGSYAGLWLFDTSAAFAFFGISALMAGITRPLIDTYLNERIPSEMRATVLSVMQLFFSLQVAFFEPALGFFADGISLAAAFIFAAIFFAAIMPPLLLLWMRANRQTPVEKPPSGRQ
ncbi:MAG TPA: MFS transporter [Tepidiformaceae bacterium]